MICRYLDVIIGSSHVNQLMGWWCIVEYGTKWLRLHKQGDRVTGQVRKLITTGISVHISLVHTARHIHVCMYICRNEMATVPPN